MSMRTAHFIAIDAGRISLRFAGDQDDADPHLFEDEAAAVRALAQNMFAVPSARLMMSSSVNWPEEDGRPEFDIDRFNAQVQQALRGLTGAPEADWAILGRFIGSWRRTTLYRLPDGTFRRRDEHLKVGSFEDHDGTSEDVARVAFMQEVDALFRMNGQPPMFETPED